MRSSTRSRTLFSRACVAARSFPPRLAYDGGSDVFLKHSGVSSTPPRRQSFDFARIRSESLLAHAPILQTECRSGTCAEAPRFLSRRGAGTFLLFLAAALLLLQLSGAWDCELGALPDEAAHYLNGLLIHDYVAAGRPAPPMRFAERFYAHYPKMAFGIWPPLFHVSEAVWMLALSPSKASVLLMLAGICALLAWLVFRTATQLYGIAAGIASGLLLVSLPVMQSSTAHVMADSLVALTEFLALLCWVRYLDSGRWRDSAAFGLWSAAAILSKYNGLALAFVPPLAIAFAGRWRLLRRWQTWLPAGIVLALCSGWYVPMRHMAVTAAQPMPGLGDIPAGLRDNAVILFGLLGAPLFVLSCAGAVEMLRRPRARRSLPACLAALIVAGCLFHALGSVSMEPRYLLPAAACLVLFLPAGVAAVARGVHGAPRWVAAGAAIAYFAVTFSVSTIPHRGYTELARTIATDPAFDKSVVLVSGSAEAEGMAVAEIAIHDRRPSHYVLRASKLIASSNWMAGDYRALYSDAPSVLAAINRAGVAAVILETGWRAAAPHHTLLAQALQAAPQLWKRDDRAAGRGFVLYRRLRRPSAPAVVEVPLRETLGRSIAVDTSKQGY